MDPVGCVRQVLCGPVITFAYLLLIGVPTVGISASTAVSSSFTLVIGVFSPADTGWEEAINLAKEGQELDNMEVELFYYRDTYDLSLDNSRRVRDMLESNSVSAIVGPYNPLLELVADDQNIPFITTTTPPEVVFVRRPGFCYHLMPSVSILNDVILDIVKAYRWDHSAVFYNKREGLTLIGELMTIPDFEVSAWKVDNRGNSSELLGHLLAARSDDLRTFLVVCDSQTLNAILKVALRLSMMSKRYHWLVLNMDSQSVDYEQYSYTMVNFTIFQLYTDSFMASLRSRPTGSDDVTVRAALAESGVDVLQFAVSVDAVRLVMTSARELMTNASECPPYCSTNHVIKGGELNPFVHQADFNGETGRVIFDVDNYRRQVTLNIMWLDEGGLINHGNWSQEVDDGSRLNMRPFLRETRKEANILGQNKVRIVTIRDPPFVMYKPDHQKRAGNDRFEGYLIDFIAKIAERMKFEYELYESPDGTYGSRNQETGQWSGMIKELILGNAAMCLGAISITSEREQVVDFTKPFKQKMFNLLMRKPERKSSIFQFLWPLSTYVWLLTISGMIVVGFLLFLMDHFSPNISAYDKSRFTLKESIWFTYGSLVGVGTEIVPRTLSGRLLSGAWWFFGLILVSSYTANLAAFLTVTKIETPIKSVADLASQTKIKYGTVKNTYAASMFETSKLEIFKKMWTAMDKVHPDAMVDNFSVGVEKVKTEDYIFIWDMPINKYIALHDCDTIAAGAPFDEKGYGIGVPMGAAYRDQVTLEILSLGEAGYMQELEEKWWGGGQCDQFKETVPSGTKELQLDNVAGVFVVVAMGALLGLIACFFEFVWRTTRSKGKKVKPPDEEGVTEREGSNVVLKNSRKYNNGAQDHYFTYGRRESRL